MTLYVNMKYAVAAFVFSFLVAPLFVFAQGPGNPGNAPVGAGAQGIVRWINDIDFVVRMLIPILLAVAVLAFFWGLVKYVWGQGKDHVSGRNTMLAGLGSLFVMITLWGILTFFQNTLGITGAQNPLNPPKVGR